MPEAQSAVDQRQRAPARTLTSREPIRLTVHIDSSTGWAPVHLRELWEYRELLSFLAWRDVRVRYEQTALGPVWALLKPLSLVFVFSVVFGWLVQMPSDGLPYPLFSLCAVLPWQLFSQTLTAASHSLVINQNLLTKVYLPRLVIPLSTMMSGLADFVVAMGGSNAVRVDHSLLYDPGLRDLARRRALVFGVERPVSRCRACAAVSHPTLVLCHPYRLSQQPRSRGVAKLVRPQSHGECGGRVSVVFARHQQLIHDNAADIRTDQYGGAVYRSSVFQACGTNLRRCRVTNG
jgi:hypothetical protein